MKIEITRLQSTTVNQEKPAGGTALQCKGGAPNPRLVEDHAESSAKEVAPTPPIIGQAPPLCATGQEWLSEQLNQFCYDNGNDDLCLKGAMIEINQSAYSVEIQMVMILGKFEMHRFKCYFGTTDPLEHMGHFLNQMEIHTGSTMQMCRVFPTSFEQGALEWLQQLPRGSTSSCDKLTKQFLRNYSNHMQERRGLDCLFEVAKKPDEPFKDYVDKFKTTLLRIETQINILY